jgi:hypothetical protein
VGATRRQQCSSSGLSTGVGPFANSPTLQICDLGKNGKNDLTYPSPVYDPYSMNIDNDALIHQPTYGGLNV